MIQADFGKDFLSVSDKLPDGSYPLESPRYVSFKGWIRGDSPCEAFDVFEALPERSEYGRGWKEDAMEKLGIPDGLFATAKDLYKEFMIQFNRNAKRVKDESNEKDPKEKEKGLHDLEYVLLFKLHPGEDQVDPDNLEWYIFSEKKFKKADVENFINVFGLVPTELSDNVWRF